VEVDQPAVTDLLSRDEVLGGLPARRASTLVFAIESRTAEVMLRARQAVTRLATERTAEQQDHAFLEALALGRELPLRPTIQDLERYASEWSTLVPGDRRVRAAMARLLGAKYVFRQRDVPRLRTALGLDTVPLAQAYEHQYHTDTQAIFTTRSSLRERLRWRQAWFAEHLETLPTFWTVFALTLTEMVGAAILALPIAIAGVGPLVGVVLLLALGVVNMVTIAALSEAFTRDGNVRYGHVYFGRLVADYLGSSKAPAVTRILLGSVSVLLLADCVGALLAYCIGVSSTLAQVSGISASIWTLLLLAVVLYFLRRKTLNLTIASALVIGSVNVGLLVVMALLVLPHASSANLLTVNLTQTGAGLVDPALLGLIFGVIMAAYFGHFSTGTCARLVLNRDPSGRSLLLGNVAAMGVAMVLNCLWVIAVSGTLPSSALANETGAAFNLLATEVGPFVTVIGMAYVILSMGMGSIHVALGVMNQMREWHSGFLVGAIPVILIFALAEWLLTAHTSFAAPLGVVGVLSLSVLGGILPALLLVASRRKGEYVPAIVVRLVGHPLVLVGVYVLFAASVFVHGTVVWADPLPRAAALLVGAALIVLTIVVIRSGALSSRVVIELRVESGPLEHIAVSVTDTGRVGSATVQLHDAAPRSAHLDLPATVARQLKLWTHQVSPSGDSVRLAARIEVHQEGAARSIDLSDSGDQALIALSGAPCQVEINL
jgi:amino acid permease